MLSTKSQHNHNCTHISGQQLLEQRSWSEKRWGGRAIGPRTRTRQDHADVELLISCKKAELCKYEIKCPKML